MARATAKDKVVKVVDTEVDTTQAGTDADNEVVTAEVAGENVEAAKVYITMDSTGVLKTVGHHTIPPYRMHYRGVEVKTAGKVEMNGAVNVAAFVSLTPEFAKHHRLVITGDSIITEPTDSIVLQISNMGSDVIQIPADKVIGKLVTVKGMVM